MEKRVRVTRAEIDLDNTLHNLREARRRLGKTKIMAVVKGNAYGHGMAGISRFLEKEGVEYLGVALLEEGISLRKAGVKAPIVVLGCIQEEEAAEALKHDLAVNLCSMQLARSLASAAAATGKRAVVHIKVDTGHIRYGLFPGDVPAFVKKVSGMKGICQEGIFSYGCAPGELGTFLQLIEALKKRGHEFSIRHIANSGCVAHGLRESYLDMARMGNFFHGSQEWARACGTKPVLSLKSAVAFVKTVPPGFYGSSGLRYELKKPANIAVAPIGCGDGIPKRVSLSGEVLIRGKRFPVVGMGMDSMRIDAGEEDLKAGEEVCIIGAQGVDEIAAREISEKVGMGISEFTSGITSRVPRVYYEGGRIREVIQE